MSQVLDPSFADKARDALGRHEWNLAFDLLSEADSQGTLAPDELELLAQAAWWVGKLPVAIDARERAYSASLKSGQPMNAVIAAIMLGRDNLLRMSIPVATAWLNHAERLLSGVEENAGHGWLAATRAMKSTLSGDLDDALAQASLAHEIGMRLNDRDLQAMGLGARGATLVAKGEVEKGMAMLDEATIAAVAGELEPSTAGSVSCVAIGTCASMGDWRRAAEWTDAQDRWCQREHINGYPGMCRLHRAEIKRLKGDWLGAEAEARRASDELAGFIPAAVGLALYEIGMIRLRRGDLPAAEEALLRAHSFGRDPEPALSLLRLAEGKIAAASASIKRAIEEPPSSPSWWAPPESGMYRLSLLPAQVEIAIAAGDVPTARAAADELAMLTERFSTTATQASSATASGAVRVAEGDHASGAQMVRNGIQLWSSLEAPYEAARARLLLARAYIAAGSRERAVMEAQAARGAFERLGAIGDLRIADEILAGLHDEADGRQLGAAAERTVKTFVFTDIVDSTKLAELLGDDAWNRLIHWHDETLRSLVAEHRGQEVKTIGDGFFLAFDDADHALECAIAIQRRLVEQRQAQGFAPAVRIGVHRAEANRVGLDYAGTGVNVAARIGGQAAAAEILVSAATLATSKRTFGETARRTVELKGIGTPVEIVSIEWR
jgi:class 3 adenylate cyclase